MRTFNVVRYILAVELPIAFLLHCGAFAFLVSSVIILFLNNVIDDILFYHGSKKVKVIPDNYSILSPVEGVVTNVEHCVPLFSHLYKRDILTKEEIISKGISLGFGDYNHVTIFLNKLNRHLVASVGKLKSMKQYSFQNGNVEMVEDGKLIADNKSIYLRNTFIELEYVGDIHVVVTMDKYISKAVVPSNTEMVEMLICRGSQCDIYVPTVDSFVLVDKGSVISALEPLFDCYFYNEKEYDSTSIRKSVEECIAKSRFSIKGVFNENFKKTLCTVNHNYFLLPVCALIALSCSVSLSIGLYIYIFLFDRSVKNFMYAMMNIIGYKEWMTKIYNSIHKLVTYGK